MSEQLKALVKLAHIDAKAKTIDERLKGIPVELEERRAGVQRLETLVARQKQNLADAERLLASQEVDLANRNELLSKAKGKGAKAKNMREAEAAERELDGIRRSIKDGEVERDNLKARIAKTRSTLDEPEKALAEAKAELEAAEAAIEARLSELRAERAVAVEGRDEMVKLIDKDMRRVYDRVVRARTPAVCEVVEGACGLCRMAVPPQRVAQILRGEIMQCHACMRFLYVPRSLEG